MVYRVYSIEWYSVRELSLHISIQVFQLHTQLAEMGQAMNSRKVVRNTEHYAATAKSLQSCPTLCNPRDGSPPGSPVPRILQARTLEWVAISFSRALCFHSIYPLYHNLPCQCERTWIAKQICCPTISPQALSLLILFR